MHADATVQRSRPYVHPPRVKECPTAPLSGRGPPAAREHLPNEHCRNRERYPDRLARRPGHRTARRAARATRRAVRSEEHTSELQSLMRISYAVFCLKKKKKISIKLA